MEEVTTILNPRERIDRLFTSPRIRNEFYDVRRKCLDVRSSKKRKEVLKNPPELYYVRKYNMAAYNTKTGKVIEGKWSDWHDTLMKDGGDEQDFIRGVVFSLCAAEDIEVFIIEMSQHPVLSRGLIEKLNDKGFQVMGSGFRWLSDADNSLGYNQLDSTLTKDVSHQE